VLAIILGAIFALALPPLHLWPAAFLAVPAVLAMLDSIKSGNWRSGFGLGWGFGFGYFLFALHWIGFAFLVEADTYLWMMPFAVAGLSAFMAIYWGLAFAAVTATGRKGLPALLLLAAALGCAEALREFLFTGFPWGAPGLIADGMGPVAQTAAIWGMIGLTPLIIVWAGAWPFVIRGKRKLAAALILATLPLSLVHGSWRLAQNDHASVAGVALRIVQPNIPQSDKWRGDNMDQIFAKLLAMSAKNNDAVTHVIWPESAVPFLIDESPKALSDAASMLGPMRLLITGSLRREQAPQEGEDRVFNSILFIDGMGQVALRYDKWRLVPGGEFLPLEWLLSPLGFRKLVTLPGSFEAGAGPQTLALPSGPPVSPSICYEAIFPDRFVKPSARPQWLVNVTNDGWFGESTGPYMHFAQARLRAIEHGLPLVRAANTGISGVIDGYGETVASLALGTEGIIDRPLPKALEPTIYSVFGLVSLLAVAAALCGLAILL
jgi:apolipoprotein N-acyltransferase